MRCHREKSVAFAQSGLCGQTQGALLQRLVPLGQVLYRDYETDRRAAVVVENPNRDLGWEEGTVLSHAQAFVLDPPITDCDLEVMLRTALSDLFRQVKNGEVMTYDLVGPVSHHPFGAGVPASHLPTQIHKKDRVVAQIFNQQARPLAAQLQVFLRKLSFGEVSSHLNEAHQFIARSADGRNDHVGPESRPVLAYPPVFLFVATVFESGAKSFGRQTCSSVFWCIESGKMLTDYLARPVALDSLSAEIPGCYVPLRIQNKDGIVLDQLHDRGEVALRKRSVSSGGLVVGSGSGGNVAVVGPHR